jgi:thiol-disulfide isomerase/thioredoxin
MKLLIFIVLIFISQPIYAAIGNTTVIVYIPEAIQKPCTVKLASKEHRYEDKSINGRFERTFQVDSMQSMSIEIDDRRIIAPFTNNLFLEPGDSLVIVIRDLENLGFKNIDISGNGSTKNLFLKEAFLAGEDYKKANYDDFKWDSIEWKFSYSLDLFREKQKILKSYSNRISDSVITILNADLNISSFALLAESLAKRIADGRRDLLPLAMTITDDSLLSPLGSMHVVWATGSESLLYTFMAALINNAHINNTEIDKDFFYLKNQKAFYDILASYLDKKSVKAYVLTSFIERRIKRLGFNAEMLQCAETFLKDSTIDAEHFSNMERLVKLEQDKAKHKYLTDFNLVDTAGNTIPLSKFRGKVMVLDFWFTGCTFCMKLIPYMEQIEKYFAGNKNVVFLAVSIDKKRELWIKKGIGKYASDKALQLYTGGLGTDHPLIQYLNFTGYPSLFIIDKEGRIVMDHTNSQNIKESSGRDNVIETIQKLTTPPI